jgi:hypothetical protein
MHYEDGQAHKYGEIKAERTAERRARSRLLAKFGPGIEIQSLAKPTLPNHSYLPDTAPLPAYANIT